ncbi:hypothetical protein C0995_007648, partial [Termitomyces sp. Mi166
MEPPFTAGLTDFAGVGLDKAVAATGMGVELEAIGTVEGPANGEANVTIGLGANLEALGTKTIGFEAERKGPAA